MIHALKIEPDYFNAVTKGCKSFEIRKNDRDFKIGDYLDLEEINYTGQYTGRWARVRVIYILADERFLQQGYIAMGISNVLDRDNYAPALLYKKAEKGWIRVKDRIPKTKEVVITLDAKGILAIARFTENERFIKENESLKDIVYWLPLPPFPTER